MKTLVELAENLEALEYDDSLLKEYKDNYDTIIKSESPEAIEELLRKNPKYFLCIAPLLVGSWSLLHRFQDIYDLLYEIDLLGQDRRMDYFNGKLIKYYALSLKFLNKPVDHLYLIRSTNKEYGNEYSVAVTTNAILERQITNHIYTTIDENVTDTLERSKYCFYLGLIYLIQGDYPKALKYLDECDILNESKKLELYIKKYTIVCKLLMSEYTLFYPYDDELCPYFSLIGCIKRGDIAVFYKLLEEHKEEYFKVNLYFVIRRLSQNLIQEGLRKITACYSRIKVQDINKILGMDVDYLIHKTINEGFIKGYVENGIFYSQQGNIGNGHCGEQIRKTIEVKRNIENKMKYPEIVPLSYEKIFENEVK
jgi:26S proteasome regulatory subunit N3